MNMPNTNKANSKNETIEHYLKTKYLFRYNSIKCQPEIKKIGEHKKTFIPVDKYILNSLKRNLDSILGISTSAENIRSILESSFSDKVNPIHEYYKNLTEYDPDKDIDFIKEFTETVIVESPEKFYEYFKKWIVAVVANSKTMYGCQNHTCLTLTGSQGKFKTTWLDLLCPRSLNQYLYTGKLNLQSKDTSALIAEMLFINIDDQLRQINKRDENELKNLITTPSVKYRRPYDIYITEYPHTASFMASVNGNDFLTDPTGSRRFLPFEVFEIDIEKAKKIDIDGIFSQAFYLFNNMFRYWFIDDEIKELHKNNQAFQVISLEEQLLIEFFEVPSTRENATDYLQPALILEHIESHTKQRLSTKKLGEALSKLGFDKWQRTLNGETKWVWSVIKKDWLKVEDSNKAGNNYKSFH